MYAVIKTGGKQYRVSPGDLLVVEKLEGEAGAEIAFNEVLMVGDEAGAEIGAPLVEGAVVRATLIETRKGDKVKVFKKIRRQGYRRTKGHRQLESVLRVTGLEGAGRAESWEGKVDLTPLSVLRLRARGLAPVVTREPAAAEAAPAPAPAAVAAPEAAPAPAPRRKAKAAGEASPAVEAAAPAPEVNDEQAAAAAPAPEAAADAPSKPKRASRAKAAAPAADADGSSEG